MKHAKHIKWREAKSIASLISQSGKQIITGYEGKEGVNFELHFRKDNYFPNHYSAIWYLANDGETIMGSGTITIEKDTKRVMDYDGCFYLASEIVSKLKSLGYDVSELID